MSPVWFKSGGISMPVGMGVLCLSIGFIIFCVYYFMDLKLDRQEEAIQETKKEGFKVSDLKQIFTSRVFFIVAALCVCFYVSIFPFQKFAVGMLSSRLAIAPEAASQLFKFFPMGAMVLTPLLGYFLDTRGRGATMLILGSLLMMICHTIFAVTPDSMFSFPIAVTAIIILGVSFSLVPASLWPSIPKLVDGKVLGSAFAVIFWFQNMGLMAVPLLIGYTLQKTNVGVSVAAGGVYNYTVPMLIFASFGVLAICLAFWLKAEDKRKGYGLELPNKKKA
jgi:sugar phosphate permease